MICTPCLREFPEDIVARPVEHVFIPVVHIGLGQHEIQEFPSFVDDEVQLETKIPSHAALPHDGMVPEPDTLVVADGDADAVNETYTRAMTEAAHLQEQHHFHRKPCLGFHEAGI